MLGDHPRSPHPLGDVLAAKEGMTSSNVPHRSLSEQDGKRHAAIAYIRQVLTNHHVNPEALARTRAHHEAMERLGFAGEQARLRRFPTNPSTQKGNLAEVVLAEYVVAASGAELPVYRLRYNPNVNQSMKGDDVLAFDFGHTPVRVIVGEAKFRGVSANAAVVEIVEALVRSHKSGVPVSLQFVADRLFEAGNVELGGRVLECAVLFALDTLDLVYVGLLLSDQRSSERVDGATPTTLRRLAMISLGVEDPDSLATECYRDLE
jgi:hypothetical protein